MKFEQKIYKCCKKIPTLLYSRCGIGFSAIRLIRMSLNINPK